MSLHDLLVAPFSYEFMRRGLLSACCSASAAGCSAASSSSAGWRSWGTPSRIRCCPGVAAAWLLFGTSTVALFFGGLIAGLLTALGSALLSRLTRIKEDAAFGSLFIVFFGAGVALISRLPTRLNLADFLFGNVLGVERGRPVARRRRERRHGRACSSSFTAASSSRRSTRCSTGRPAGAAAWSTWASSR